MDERLMKMRYPGYDDEAYVALQSIDQHHAARRMVLLLQPPPSFPLISCYSSDSVGDQIP
jgi:hypothetical protein